MRFVLLYLLYNGLASNNYKQAKAKWRQQKFIVIYPKPSDLIMNK